MSFKIPTNVLEYINSAPPTHCRAACQSIPGGSPDWPNIILLLNGNGVSALLEILAHAVETAPDEERKEGWRGLAYQITSAVQQTLTS